MAKTKTPTQEWKVLYKTNKSEYHRLYNKFMIDPANIFACKYCPINKEKNDGSRCRLPCGEYSCWVTASFIDVKL